MILRNEDVKNIAERLDVSEDEVVSMNRRLAGKEHSLNAPIGEDGDEWQDWVVDQNMDQELENCTTRRNGTKKRFII